MKLDKFNEITDKVINILDEEYSLMENDDFGNNAKSTEQILQEKKRREQMKAKASYQKVKAVRNNPAVSEETKQNIEFAHKRDVADRKEAEAKKAKYMKLKGMRVNQESVELEDSEVYLLAEEFEYDLNEANLSVNSAMNTAKAALQTKIDSDKAKLNQQKEMIKTQNANEKAQSDEKIQKIEQNAELQKKKEQENLAKQQAQKESKLKTDIQRIEAKQDTVKAMNTAMNIGSQNASYDIPNTAEMINEGLKAMKARKIAKARDEVDEKRGDVIIKIEKLKTKLEKAANKNDTKKVDKYTNKINKVYEKYQKLDDEYKKQDKKLVDIGEDRLEENLSTLLSGYTELLNEATILDEEFILIEEKSSLDLECESIINKQYDDAMLTKIANQIKALYTAVPKNELEIKKSLMLFKQYKNR